MNKKLFFIFLISVFLSAAAAADVFAYEKTDITAYIFDKDHTTTFHCISANDLPVPYVDVEEYLDTLCDEDFQTTGLNNGTFKISTVSRDGIILDPGNDTIHFDRFEQVVLLYSIVSTPYCFVKDYEYIGNISGCDFDLHKYNIDIIEEGGKIYLPLTTISDITSGRIDLVVYGKDGENWAIYISSDPSKDFDSTPPVDGTYIFDQPVRHEAEISYTYNELCFVMDNLYGCPSSCILADSIEKIGFDRTLDTYSDDTRYIKNLLLSDNTVDHLLGLLSVFSILYDGGHTGVFTESVRNTWAWGQLIDIYDNNPDDPRMALYIRINGRNTDDFYKKYRIVQCPPDYSAYEPVFSYSENGYDYSYYEYDDTGIYQFNSYDDEAVSYFKEALDHAKAHGIKNFCIDVSRNGGGLLAAEGYLYAAMTGDERGYYDGSTTGNHMEEVMELDMDLDGVFEGTDEDFDYDFNYAVLCSGYTYSAGNTLSCLAKETGIPVLGEKSRGGTSVVHYFFTPNGALYTISSYQIMSYKRGGNTEAGAEPDYDLTKTGADGETDYSDFSNFQLIDSILDKHYSSGNKVEPGLTPVTVSDNKPMAVSTETRGDFRITYPHELPFYANGKVTPEYFGEITVSQGNATYKATKIKVNKKKHMFQITGLSGADKDTVKKIKKATKGSSRLPFRCNPYYVRDTDRVTPKFKKSGDLKSVKIWINNKYYKAKKNEFSYDSSKKLILFKGKNLNGSYTSK